MEPYLPYGRRSEIALRAGDADRDRVADELAAAFGAGRLTADEHAERLDRCYAAVTLDDLAVLVADLPSESRRAPVRPPVALLPVLVLLVALSAILHAPIAPIGFLVIVMARRRALRAGLAATPRRPALRG